MAAFSLDLRRRVLADCQAGPTFAAVADKPDRTLEQLRQHLGGAVSIGTLWKALRALKISFKKSRSGRPSEIAPTSRPAGRRGGGGRPASTRTGSSSSTRRG